MEELIDVLDEDGKKTGEIVTRREVHVQGLWHRIIVVAIIDKNGKILMQQRATEKETNPGKWDVSVAGHISAGQSSAEAAIREVFEEVGINIKEDELKYICLYKDSCQIREDYISNHFYDFYIVEREIIDMDNIKIQESEVKQVKLCGRDEVQKMLSDEQVVKRGNIYKELIKYLK